jgi:hypothetical protein
MRTVTYNDESAPWSRSNQLTGIRLLPSSNDSNIFSRTLLRTLRLEIMRFWSTGIHL